MLEDNSALASIMQNPPVPVVAFKRGLSGTQVEGRLCFTNCLRHLDPTMSWFVFQAFRRQVLNHTHGMPKRP
jgi:hypothetical protein